jgi:hypothetical protein
MQHTSPSVPFALQDGVKLGPLRVVETPDRLV